jgi:hypothetical protein
MLLPPQVLVACVVRSFAAAWAAAVRVSLRGCFGAGCPVVVPREEIGEGSNVGCRPNAVIRKLTKQRVARDTARGTVKITREFVSSIRKLKDRGFFIGAQ